MMNDASREPVRLRHFEKIADGIDVHPLLEQIAAHPELWNQHGIRKEGLGTPHREMSDIWVRYNDIARFDAANPQAFNAEHVPIWYQAWQALPALRPIIFDLMARVMGEMLGGVLITRIPPGCGIALHTDRGWHVEFYDKFYLSLRSAPGAVFGCEHDGVREELNPRPGEIYLFDNRKPHWVENRSDDDRVTLIACVRTDKFGRGI